MNAEHGVCNLLLVVLSLQNRKDQKNINRKLFHGSSVLMVYFLPTVIQSCLLCQHLLQCKGHLPSLQDCLVQPCHSGFHLLSHKIQFSWEQTCIFPLFCLPAVWECVYSVGFFVPSSFGWFGYPITVCRPPVVLRPWVEEHCLMSLTEASPKHKDTCQFSLPENLFPQPVFSQHLPHLHIQLLLFLLWNLIQNDPLLGTDTLVGVLFHLPLDG